MRRRHSVGVHNGLLPAGHADVLDVIPALVAAQIGHQELPAPDGAVLPVTRAVHAHAEHRSLAAVLRKTGGDVGVMVLDLDQLDPPRGAQLSRKGGGGVVRMHVADHDLRLDPQQAAELLEALREIRPVVCIAHVADVLRQEHAPPARHGERVVKHRAGREHRRPGAAQEHGLRHVAPRAAHGQQLPVESCHDRIVAAVLYRPVVRQHPVHHVRQLTQHGFLSDRDGFLGAVAARHDKRRRRTFGLE